MKVFAAPFKGIAPNASVLLGVELRGRDLTTAANASIELAVFAVDAKGKMKASSRETVALNLKPETKTRVEQIEHPPAQPHEHPARDATSSASAAHDLSGGALGSVLYDLDVPDFEKEPLVDERSRADVGRRRACADGQARRGSASGAARARRSRRATFPQNDQIAFFTDVYDNDVSPVHTVDITATLTSDEGRVVFKNAEERSTADLAGKKGGFGYGAAISLTDYPPGPVRPQGRGALASWRQRHGEPRSADHDRAAGDAATMTVSMPMLSLIAIFLMTLQAPAPDPVARQGPRQPDGRRASGDGAHGGRVGSAVAGSTAASARARRSISRRRWSWRCSSAAARPPGSRWRSSAPGTTARALVVQYRETRPPAGAHRGAGADDAVPHRRRAEARGRRRT